MFARKSLVEALRAENARLSDELATYKHAFETTRDDRDRIKAMLETAEQRSHRRSPPLSQDAANASLRSPETLLYGPMWGRVADDYAQIVGDEAMDREAFHRILHYGGFSQLLMDIGHAVQEPLVDWQIRTLGAMGLRLDSLPAVFGEAEIIPAQFRFERFGRQVSADFLRLLSYVHMIQTHAGPEFAPRLIVEIGSGYGSLARLLKAAYPGASVCLVDIPMSLRAAEFYLRQAMPSARVAWVGDRTDGFDRDQADFLLLPADRAERLEGQTIDLAVNTWSFGEMPNAQVQQWFDLIQRRNRTEYLFLLNHFMAPIRLDADSLRHQMDHYSWITGLDRAWQIRCFEIDPPIEQPPFIRHKHRGVAMLAARLNAPAEIERCAELATDTARAVHVHDWVRGSLTSNQPAGSDPNAARRAFLAHTVEPLTDQTKFVLDQFARTLDLWRPDLDGSEDGTFFRLWNDIRMNGSALSVRLMRIWLHLQWHPILRSADGTPVDSIFREELIYGLSSSGVWMQDEYLEVPDWLDGRIKCL